MTASAAQRAHELGFPVTAAELYRVALADPGADRALLDAVADWCDRYTPLVALDGDDGLMLDITGCAHLFGGEEALLAQVAEDCADLAVAMLLALSRGLQATRPALPQAITRPTAEALRSGTASTGAFRRKSNTISRSFMPRAVPDCPGCLMRPAI